MGCWVKYILIDIDWLIGDADGHDNGDDDDDDEDDEGDARGGSASCH